MTKKLVSNGEKKIFLLGSSLGRKKASITPAIVDLPCGNEDRIGIQSKLVEEMAKVFSMAFSSREFPEGEIEYWFDYSDGYKSLGRIWKKEIKRFQFLKSDHFEPMEPEEIKYFQDILNECSGIIHGF